MDSKDHSTGMSSPPLSFVKKDFLEAARNMLVDDGKMAFNYMFYRLILQQVRYCVTTRCESHGRCMEIGIAFSSSGIFVTNLAARNKELRETVIKSFNESFSTLLTIPIPEDVNEVLVGIPHHIDEVTLSSATTRSGSLRTSRPKLTCNSHLKDSVANLASMIAENSGGSQDAQNVTGTLVEHLENAVLLM